MVVKRGFLVAFVACIVCACESPKPDVAPEKAPVEAAKKEEPKAPEEPVVKKEEPKEKKGPPARVLKESPLSEEHHALKVSWKGSGEQKRELREKPDATSKSLGMIELKKDAVIVTEGAHMNVTKPRTLTSKKDQVLKVYPEGASAEIEVEFKASQQIHVYVYEGEGMCLVAYEKGDGNYAFGSTSCPENVDDGADWTVKPGGVQNRADELAWWVQTGEQKGWLLIDDDFDMILKMTK